MWDKFINGAYFLVTMGLDRRSFLRTSIAGGVGTAVLKQPAVALAEKFIGNPESLPGTPPPRFSAEERWDLDYQIVPLNEYLQGVYDKIDSEIRLWMCDTNATIRGDDDIYHFAKLVGHPTSDDTQFSRSSLPYGVREEVNEDTRKRTAEVLKHVRDPAFQKYVENKEGEDPVLTPRKLRILLHDYQKRMGESPEDAHYAINEEKEDQYFARQRERKRNNPTRKEKRKQRFKDAEVKREYQLFIERLKNEGPIPHLNLRDYQTPDGGSITMIDTLSGSVLGAHYDPSFFDDLQSFSNAEIMRRLAIAYLDTFSNNDPEVTILYPAAGDHIAGLELGMSLLEQGSMDCVNYTFTDIDEEARDTTVELLKRLSQKGLFELVSESTQEFDMGEETTVELGYRNGQITLTYALNRSGGKTFRQSQIGEADIILLHDALWNFGKFGLPEHRQREVLRGIQKSGRSGQVVIHDWYLLDHEKGLPVASPTSHIPVIYDMVPAHEVVIPGMYGCVSDHPLYPGKEDHLGVNESIMKELKTEGAKIWMPVK